MDQCESTDLAHDVWTLVTTRCGATSGGIPNTLLTKSLKRKLDTVIGRVEKQHNALVRREKERLCNEAAAAMYNAMYADADDLVRPTLDEMCLERSYRTSGVCPQDRCEYWDELSFTDGDLGEFTAECDMTCALFRIKVLLRIVVESGDSCSSKMRATVDEATLHTEFTLSDKWLAVLGLGRVQVLDVLKPHIATFVAAIDDLAEWFLERAPSTCCDVVVLDTLVVRDALYMDMRRALLDDVTHVQDHTEFAVWVRTDACPVLPRSAARLALVRSGV